MKKNVRVALIFACVALSLLAAACSGQTPETFVSDDRTFLPTKEKTTFVCIEMDTGKRMVAELYPDQAPITVENFQKLVAEGFYDGLTFHRISSNFVIQGGDPEGTGRGGPGYSIKGEFSANGVNNTLSHERGVLSMARSQAYNSGGSQFFICLNTPVCAQLDGKYAAFGKVIAGMDVVDEIAAVQVSGETPLEKQVMKRVYFVVPQEENSTTTEAPAFEMEDLSGYTKTEEKGNLVCIEMEDGWKMVVELYPDQAPITVDNFKKLVSENFYDGLTFHRISQGFVIQGGDPDGNGGGGPGYTIKGEFSANGVNNTLSHEKGVISMARTSLGYDTAGSQFFICLDSATCAQLDGQYAAFGKVIGGMSTVEKIAATATAGETPLAKQTMKEVYFVQAPTN